jgi:hypothetical protein
VLVRDPVALSFEHLPTCAPGIAAATSATVSRAQWGADAAGEDESGCGDYSEAVDRHFPLVAQPDLVGHGGSEDLHPDGVLAADLVQRKPQPSGPDQGGHRMTQFRTGKDGYTWLPCWIYGPLNPATLPGRMP